MKILLIFTVAFFTVSYACESQECPSPKLWSSRKCACVCPITTKCYPVGAIFDEDTCTYCLPKICGEGQVNDNHCNCVDVCDEVCPAPDNLNDNQRWNYDTCEVECIDECCEEPKVLDPADCTCKCPNDMSDNLNDNQRWNEDTCEIECIDECCPTPKELNSTDCSCVCPNAMDEPPPKKELDTETCLYVCIDDPPTDLDETIKEWDEDTCEVVCKNIPDSCDGNQEFNEAICECECPEVPDYDPEIQTYDNVTCETNCIYDPYECQYDGMEWNVTTCNCTCPNEAEVAPTCEEPAFFNHLGGCQCTEPCEPQDPPSGGCPDPRGYQYWCSETCQCECKYEYRPKDNCGDIRSWNVRTCNCECDEVLDCSYNSDYEFKFSTCDCGCRDDDPGCNDLNPLWTYDEVDCNCACIDETDRVNCPSNSSPSFLKIWKPSTCSCVCKDEYRVDCNPEVHSGYNEDTCTCDCIAQEPAGGCQGDTYWDKELCNCEPCPGTCPTDL